MNRLLTAGILVIAMPLYAHGQQPNAAKLKADAQKVVSVIRDDKAKTQTYCELADLSEQADQEQNAEKAEELSQKINELEKNLGPEYLALIDGLKSVNPNSRDGQEIGSTLEKLDEFCDE